jgi:hypothetical protein
MSMPFGYVRDGCVRLTAPHACVSVGFGCHLGGHTHTRCLTTFSFLLSVFRTSLRPDAQQTVNTQGQSSCFAMPRTLLCARPGCGGGVYVCVIRRALNKVSCALSKHSRSFLLPPPLASIMWLSCIRTLLTPGIAPHTGTMNQKVLANRQCRRQPMSHMRLPAHCQRGR